MDYIKLTNNNWPELHNTLFVVAFSGWNDAAGSATTAARILVEQLEAVQFANIDPEDFYVFTETRPEISLLNEGLRKLSWPSNQFYYVENVPSLNRSLIIMVGVEPDLKWRTFSNAVMEICRKCNVTETVLLGAMVATVPHTRPVPLTGWTTNPEREDMLEKVEAQRSRYEGPTGIVGVLATFCQAYKIPYVSIWAVSPTYLSVSPNWKVASRLLESIVKGFSLELDMSEIQRASLRFEAQVAEAIARQADIATFVHALEENYDRSAGENEDEKPDWLSNRSDEEGELPSADILIQELEQQLRKQREERNDK